MWADKAVEYTPGYQSSISLQLEIGRDSHCDTSFVVLYRLREQSTFSPAQLCTNLLQFSSVQPLPFPQTITSLHTASDKTSYTNPLHFTIQFFSIAPLSTRYLRRASRFAAKDTAPPNQSTCSVPLHATNLLTPETTD